ncbi:MAG: MFS transporter [Vampirovibrionia bacterium]
MKSDTTNSSYKFITIILLLSSTMAIMGDFTISPALPRISGAFQNIDNAEYLVKLILSIPALFIALSSPIIGVLLDKWGRKPVLIASIILYIIAGTSALYLNILELILIGRAFFGIAVAGTLITSTTMIGDFFNDTALNKVMGYQSASIGFAGVIFLTLGGFLADIHWRAPFYVYFIGFIYLIMVLTILPESQKEMKTDNKDVSQKEKIAFKGILSVYIISFVLMVFFYMIPIQIPFYLKEINITSNTFIGIALASEALISAISSLFYKKLKDKLSFKQIFILSFIIIGAGYIFISLVSNYFLIMLGLIIIGIGIGQIIPNINVCLISITQISIRGTVIGAMGMCYFIGQFCSQIFIQPVIDITNIETTFLITGLIMVVIPALFLIKNKKSILKQPS